MKVLILDDDPVSLTKLQHDLTKLGHDVISAQDSVQAMNLYYEHDNIELIISDLEMPHRRGEDFIKDIREIDRKLPVIVVSGAIDEESLLKLRRLRCSDIMVKPYNQARLASVLKKL